MRKLRVVGFGFVAAIVSCLIILIAGEGLTRSYERVKGVDFRIMRKELMNAERLPRDLWLEGNFPRLRPYARVTAKTSEFQVDYAINSKGWRDREYSYERVPGKFRVLALGDSFTFGEGVRYGERFVDIPEDRFANLEMIAMAVPGYGIEHELICFAMEGLKYSPDCVILFINRVDTTRQLSGLFDGTRISMPQGRTYDDYKINDSPGTVYLNRQDSSRPSGLLRLLDYSHMFHFGAGRIELYRLAARDRSIWTGKAPYKDDSSPVEEPDEKIRERTIRVLEKFAEIAASNRIQLLVINIDPHYHLSYIKNALQEGAYFDESDALSRRARATPLRFVYDRHFNRETHRFLGEETIEILKKAAPSLQPADGR